MTALACGPEPATTDTEGPPAGSSSSGSADDSSSDASTADAPTTGAGTDSTAGTTTAGTTTIADTDSTGDEPSACVEFSVDHGELDEFPPPMFGCDATELCPGAEPGPLVIVMEGLDDVKIADLERGRCMARALRDRTRGEFRFTIQPALGYDSYSVEILGEQVIFRNHEVQDFNDFYEEEGRGLFPPEDYAGCAEGTQVQVHECLTRGYQDACVPDPLVCPE